jgi:hypothetical protein
MFLTSLQSLFNEVNTGPAAAAKHHESHLSQLSAWQLLRVLRRLLRGTKRWTPWAVSYTCQASCNVLALLNVTIR